MSNGRKLQVEDGLDGVDDWHMDMEMIDDAIQSQSTLLEQEQANTILTIIYNTVYCSSYLFFSLVMIEVTNTETEFSISIHSSSPR